MARHGQILAAIALLTVGFALTAVSSPPAWAKAPGTKDVMQPVDTSAGSITDVKHLLQVDLDRQVSVDVSSLPIEVALHQVSAVLGLEWGYTKEVDHNKPVTLTAQGSARSVLKALGKAANVRFEVGGPTQMRLVPARSAERRRPPPPPPAKP